MDDSRGPSAWGDLPPALGILLDEGFDPSRDPPLAIDRCVTAAETMAKLLLASVEAVKPGALGSVVGLPDCPTLFAWILAVDRVALMIERGHAGSFLPNFTSCYAAFKDLRDGPYEEDESEGIPPGGTPGLVRLRNDNAHGGLPRSGVALGVLGRLQPKVRELAGLVSEGLRLNDIGAGPGSSVARLAPLIVSGRTVDEAHRIFVRAEGSQIRYCCWSGPEAYQNGTPVELQSYRDTYQSPAESDVEFWNYAEQVTASRAGRSALVNSLVLEITHAEPHARRPKERRTLLEWSMGMGKSVVLAGVALELRKRRPEATIFHRFRQGEAHCSVEAFLRFALASAGVSTPNTAALAEREFRQLLQRGEFTIVCDGLDELEHTHPGSTKRLVNLSAAGGVWLFGSRPYAELDEAFGKAVTRNRLGRLETEDLIQIIDRRAVGVVRDAMNTAPTTSSGDSGESPYARVIAESADGLPLFVVLFLEWLEELGDIQSIKAAVGELEEGTGTAPPGLNLIYEHLLAEWSQRTSGLELPLCLLARSEEPVTASMLAELAFRRVQDLDGRAKRMSSVLSRLGAVLAVDRTPEGRLFYSFNHASVADFISESETLKDHWLEAGDALADASLEPKARPASAGMLWRQGIRYVLSSDQPVDAARLLTEPDYLDDRVNRSDDDCVRRLLEDYERCERALQGDPVTLAAVRRWRGFLSSVAPLIIRPGPAQRRSDILGTLAATLGSASPVADAYRQSPRDLAFVPVNPEAIPAPPNGSVMAFDTHHGDVDIVASTDAHRLLTAGETGVLQRWDTFTGELVLAAPEPATGEIQCLLTLPDDRVALATRNPPEILLLDLSSEQEVWRQTAPTVFTSMCLAGENLLVAASFFGELQIFDLDSGDELSELVEVLQSEVLQLTASDDHRVVAQEKATVTCISLDGFDVTWQINDVNDLVPVSTSQVLIARANRAPELVSIATGQAVRALEAEAANRICRAGPDHIAGWSGPRRMFLRWNLENGALSDQVFAPAINPPTNIVSCSPDLLASVAGSRASFVSWDSHEVLNTVDAGEPIRDACWVPGAGLATAHEDRALLWDPTSPPFDGPRSAASDPSCIGWVEQATEDTFVLNNWSPYAPSACLCRRGSGEVLAEFGEGTYAFASATGRLVIVRDDASIDIADGSDGSIITSILDAQRITVDNGFVHIIGVDGSELTIDDLSPPPQRRAGGTREVELYVTRSSWPAEMYDHRSPPWPDWATNTETEAPPRPGGSLREEFKDYLSVVPLDGTRYAFGTHDGVFGVRGADGEELRIHNFPYAVFVRNLADGAFVAAFSYETLLIYSPVTWECLYRMEFTFHIEDVAILTGGDRATLVVTGGPTPLFFDLTTPPSSRSAVS